MISMNDSEEFTNGIWPYFVEVEFDRELQEENVVSFAGFRMWLEGDMDKGCNSNYCGSTKKLSGWNSERSNHAKLEETKVDNTINTAGVNHINL
jgi:hypothetical protein